MSDWIDYDTEAGHLYEMYDGDEIEEDMDVTEEFYDKVAEGIVSDENRYKKNKNSKVGDIIICAGPLCNKKIKKKQYSQAFCCSHCKDQFWNRRENYFGYRKPIK